MTPVSRLAPTWENVLAHINPMYYVVQADRVLAGGQIISGTVGLAFIVMVGRTMVTLTWSIRACQRAISRV